MFGSQIVPAENSLIEKNKPPDLSILILRGRDCIHAAQRCGSLPKNTLPIYFNPPETHYNTQDGRFRDLTQR